VGFQDPAPQGPRRPLHEWPPVKSAPGFIDFPPANFQTPCQSRLRFRHRTDVRTDNGNQCVIPHPMGAEA